MFRALIPVLLWLVLLTGTPAFSDERILSYDSTITVEQNGDFLVEETIRVRAEGKQISRGIYRDFPTIVSGENGNRRVGFDLLSATRNDTPEQTRIDEGSNAIRIYLGDPDRTIAQGEHVYRIAYRTDRQLRRFADHDEIYWNVTGTEWLFPIDQITATVKLPADAQITGLTAYTGAYGETGSDADVQQIAPNIARFETTRTLNEREGLTIAVSFPKGVVAPAGQNKRIVWFLRDFADVLWGLAGLFVALSYYFYVWWYYGRDPKPGTIIPRWEPPAGLSAALTRSIWKDRKLREGEALSLTTVEMASKGFISIYHTDQSTRLISMDSQMPGDLPPEQRLVRSTVEEHSGELHITKTNGALIKSLQRNVANHIRRQRRALGYYRNYLWQLAGGLFLSVLLIIFLAFQLPDTHSAAMIGFVAFAFVGLQLGRQAIAARNASLKSRIVGIFGLLIIIPALFQLSTEILEGGGWHLPLAMLGIVAVTAIFAPILGGPTQKGRAVLDEIEGLREYIRIAEQDRLKIDTAPEMSRVHFERILPFAMALDLEQVWTRRFQEWLTLATAAGAASVASSFSGNSGLSMFYDGNSPSSSLSNIESTLSSSFTSALPVAKSSSSGFSSGSSSGGGFSGGGGGGGGGGGW